MGVDLIIGIENNSSLSSYIREYLVEMRFTTLAHIKRPHWILNGNSHWLTSEDIGLCNIWVEEWAAFISNMNAQVLVSRIYKTNCFGTIIQL